MSITFRAALLVLSAALAWPAAGSVPQLPRASFLGVQADAISADARARLKLGDTSGALVIGLVEGGSAKAAGLRPDDVIVAVDGAPVTSADELIVAIRKHVPGQRLQLTYVRDGSRHTALVVLGSARSD